ncbi:MAG: hypothetical protein KAW94_01300 [Candidatus Thorarchaeota archaeon]|nr:hypothetical protein [Candidatus Thorarchaeota archaeon]
MRNKKAFIMCLVGGILLFLASAIGSIGMYGTIVTFVADQYPEMVGVLDNVLLVLSFIAGLGGIGVIIGGYMLTTDRFGTGKFIIGIAAGMGLVGLIIVLAQHFMLAGTSGVVDYVNLMVSQGSGWIGAVLAILGRKIAGKPE